MIWFFVHPGWELGPPIPASEPEALSPPEIPPSRDVQASQLKAALLSNR
ncbi:MAG: hypothetical protein AB1758_17030 [Candidatus Eremiobacterota bacterium]